MNVHVVKAKTLPDAWFQLLFDLVRGDAPKSIYQIDKGSYIGEKRLEFQHVTIQIDYPGTRPLIPDIPPGVSIPPPVESMDYIEDYFVRYLMSDEIADNETYTYGTWLKPGIARVIEQLKGSAGNNQATISIGGLSNARGEIVDTDNFIDPATGQRDPACLRVVDFRLDQDNVLHMVVLFRSWCLWGGLPANLAGLQLVKEYVAHELGANDGKIIASSKGLHIYSYAAQTAGARFGLSDVSSLEDLLNSRF